MFIATIAIIQIAKLITNEKKIPILYNLDNNFVCLLLLFVVIFGKNRKTKLSTAKIIIHPPFSILNFSLIGLSYIMATIKDKKKISKVVVKIKINFIKNSYF